MRMLHQVHRLEKMLSAAEEERQKTQLEAEASASVAQSEIDRCDTNQVYYHRFPATIHRKSLHAICIIDVRVAGRWFMKTPTLYVECKAWA